MRSAPEVTNDIRVVTKAYTDLLAEHKDKPDGPPSEVQAQLTGFYQKALDFRAELQGIETMDTERKGMDEMSNFLHDPKYRMPRVFTPDDDGMKSLRDMGWEKKGDMLYAPTSSGQLQAMFPQEVVYGDIPENMALEAKEFFQKTRVALQPGYRDMYGKLIKGMARYKDLGQTMFNMTDDERKALSEGTDTAGGVFVPPEMTGEILMQTAQRAVMRSLATVQSASRDVLKWFRVLPNSNSSLKNIYSSGFVGTWDVETPVFTQTDPAFGGFDVAIKKLRVATLLSNDFISDSVVDILAWLALNGANNMALTEDLGFISGSGAALEPKGILYCGATTVDVEGSTSNTISNTTSSPGSAPKLIDLIYDLPSQYAESPSTSLLMRRSVEGHIRKLVDAQGRFLWPMLAGSAFAGPNGVGARSLLEYNVRNTDWMPKDDTDANKVIIYGDFKNYIIAQRAQITTTFLRERWADTDQTGIILWERVGGDCWNPEAFRFGIV